MSLGVTGVPCARRIRFTPSPLVILPHQFEPSAQVPKPISEQRRSVVPKLRVLIGRQSSLRWTAALERGVQWMARGMTHLLLYRVVDGFLSEVSQLAMDD